MTEVVIAGAARTPVGAFSGGLSSVPASDLGSVAISAALERAGVPASEVDEVILGQILTAGTGQNPARQAAIGAGVPQEKTAYQINQLCFQKKTVRQSIDGKQFGFLYSSSV